MPDLHVDEAKPFRVAGRASFATYRSPTFAGEYQGYAAAASYSHPWVYADVSLAGYRIVRNGLAQRGLGDLALDVRASLYRAGELALGLELAATMPTGAAHLGLGMGHAMLMPGAWLSLRSERVLLFAQLACGRSVGDSGGFGHHHQATGPLVNPMNRSELEHALTASYLFSKHLFAGARLTGAVPVVALGGQAREVAGLGLGASFAPVQIDLELQLPLVGTPFETRTILTAAALF